MHVKKTRCERAGCAEKRRSGGRYCGGCFAAANRRSHATHRRERNARRRDRAGKRDACARARDSARAKLYVAISRGKMTKEPCARCGKEEVVALIPDPARWREVVWLCREDVREHGGFRSIAGRSRADHEARRKEREGVLAAVAALPLEVRERLYAIAAQGPAGITLAPDAPLFTMRLIRAYRSLQMRHRLVKKSTERKAAERGASFPFGYALELAQCMGKAVYDTFLFAVEASFQALEWVESLSDQRRRLSPVRTFSAGCPAAISPRPN